MKKRNPFHSLSPSFFSGLLDDPLLFIRVPPPEQNILVDCGQLDHLAKRTLKSVGSLFISHAHMDHFIGIDKFTRSILVSSKTIDLFGPPDISRKLAAKLQGYDWNLVEHFFCRFRVHEVSEDEIQIFSLPGAEGFKRRFIETVDKKGRHLTENRSVIVDGALCDHRIPTLIVKFTEKPVFLIDEERVSQQGLVRGPWIPQLKEHFYSGQLPLPVMTIEQRNGERSIVITEKEAHALYEKISKKQAVSSIGYLTDVGFSKSNINKILNLFEGVTLLVCECTYLSAQLEKARRSCHLCTSDLNQLIRELQPDFLLPMHLSKTYLGKTHLLYEELEIPDGCQLIKLPDRVTPEPITPLGTPDLLTLSDHRN
ncbi:MAG: MBL fold metallo-hydrolase [bacterium]